MSLLQDSQTFPSEQAARLDSSDFGSCAFKLSSTIPKIGCPKPRTHKASFPDEVKPRVCTAAIVPITGHSTRSICCRPQPARHNAATKSHNLLYLDDFILAENPEVYVRAPDFAKRSPHRILGDMRHVAVARKMREREFP